MFNIGNRKPFVTLCRHCVMLIYVSAPKYNLYYPSYNEGSWVIAAVFDAFFAVIYCIRGGCRWFQLFFIGQHRKLLLFKNKHWKDIQSNRICDNVYDSLCYKILIFSLAHFAYKFINILRQRNNRKNWT